MHVFVENNYNFDLKTKRMYTYQLVYIKVSGSFLFNNIAICAGKIVICSLKKATKFTKIWISGTNMIIY